MEQDNKPEDKTPPVEESPKPVTPGLLAQDLIDRDSSDTPEKWVARRNELEADSGRPYFVRLLDKNTLEFESVARTVRSITTDKKGFKTVKKIVGYNNSGYHTHRIFLDNIESIANEIRDSQVKLRKEVRMSGVEIIYTAIFQALNETIKVDCNCNFFRFYGIRHNLDDIGIGFPLHYFSSKGKEYDNMSLSGYSASILQKPKKTTIKHVRIYDTDSMEAILSTYPGEIERLQKELEVVRKDRKIDKFKKQRKLATLKMHIIGYSKEIERVTPIIAKLKNANARKLAKIGGTIKTESSKRIRVLRKIVPVELMYRYGGNGLLCKHLRKLLKNIRSILSEDIDILREQITVVWEKFIFDYEKEVGVEEPGLEDDFTYNLDGLVPSGSIVPKSLDMKVDLQDLDKLEDDLGYGEDSLVPPPSFAPKSLELKPGLTTSDLDDDNTYDLTSLTPSGSIVPKSTSIKGVEPESAPAEQETDSQEEMLDDDNTYDIKSLVPPSSSVPKELAGQAVRKKTKKIMAKKKVIKPKKSVKPEKPKIKKYRLTRSEK